MGISAQRMSDYQDHGHEKQCQQHRADRRFDIAQVMPEEEKPFRRVTHAHRAGEPFQVREVGAAGPTGHALKKQKHARRGSAEGRQRGQPTTGRGDGRGPIDDHASVVPGITSVAKPGQQARGHKHAKGRHSRWVAWPGLRGHASSA